MVLSVSHAVHILYNISKFVDVVFRLTFGLKSCQFFQEKHLSALSSQMYLQCINAFTNINSSHVPSLVLYYWCPLASLFLLFARMSKTTSGSISIRLIDGLILSL